MINPGFDQYIEGFANLTSVRNCPIFIGNPHMMLADPYWSQQIVGMKTPDPDRDLTTVDIEPYTGKVLQVNKNLQVNALIPQDTSQFMYYNPGIRTGIMYPIMWAYEKETLTTQLADKIKDQLYSIITIEGIIIPVFAPLGIFLILLGLLFVIPCGIFNFRLQKIRSNYERINALE